jgi:hypothetical protein
VISTRPLKDQFFQSGQVARAEGLVKVLRCACIIHPWVCIPLAKGDAKGRALLMKRWRFFMPPSHWRPAKRKFLQIASICTGRRERVR